MIRLQLIGIWFLYSLSRLWSSRNYEFCTLFRFQRHIFLGEFCGHLTLWLRIFWIPKYWVSVRIMWKSAELQVASLSHAWAPHPHTGHTPGQSWHVEASDSSKNFMCKKENHKNHGAIKKSLWNLYWNLRESIQFVDTWISNACMSSPWSISPSIFFFLKHLQVKLLRCQCQRPIWLRWAWPWHECVAAEAPGRIVAGGRCRKNSFKSLKMFEEIHVNAIQCLSFR